MCQVLLFFLSRYIQNCLLVDWVFQRLLQSISNYAVILAGISFCFKWTDGLLFCFSSVLQLFSSLLCFSALHTDPATCSKERCKVWRGPLTFSRHNWVQVILTFFQWHISIESNQQATACPSCPWKLKLSPHSVSKGCYYAGKSQPNAILKKKNRMWISPIQDHTNDFNHFMAAFYRFSEFVWICKPFFL